jgi:hypothetical protein
LCKSTTTKRKVIIKMSLSRRSFLTILSCAPFATALRHASGMPQRALSGGDAPAITNYNARGNALLVEGKTLLIALTFKRPVRDLTASLPVPLNPEWAGGPKLTEPQELFFYATKDSRTFHTILSAPLDSVVGKHTLHVTAREADGASQRWTFPYSIQEGTYRNTSLSLDENFSAPPPEVAAQMQRDFETIVEMFQHRSARQWREAFVRPVTGADKDNFGVKRTVNRTKHYRHNGLDFKAGVGTAVRAINAGIVAFSGEQWTPGQTVCIDHGGSVFSKYNHLSERRVRVGDHVSRGQMIALSGQSGGQKPPPHLHLSLIINRTPVDPEDFMQTARRLIALEAGGSSAHGTT